MCKVFFIPRAESHFLVLSSVLCGFIFLLVTYICLECNLETLACKYQVYLAHEMSNLPP